MARKSRRQPDGYRNRRTAGRSQATLFLIVCGGTSEKCYFEALRTKLRLGAVVTILKKDRHPVGIVDHAVRENLRRGGMADQLWAVFDKDSFGDFDQAVANDAQVACACSNPCFELWLLLHYRYTGAASSCEALTRAFRQHSGMPQYTHGDDVFAMLEARLDVAVEHARQLEERHRAESKDAHTNPSTNVHHLVSRLREAG